MERRSQRINFENIIFLFTENETFSKLVIEDFLKIKGKNKLCLIIKDYGLLNDSLIIDSRAGVERGNLAWTPKIILSVVNWKNVLNELIT